jgi:rubredoxin
MDKTIKCSFCGMEFTEEQGYSACGSCPISNCKLIKCPNCGYESIPEPASLNFLKNIFTKKQKS